jgi:hypothetical protein
MGAAGIDTGPEAASSRQLGQSATFSPELRPPIETIQTAVRRIADGLSVIEGWARRMGAAGFDISGADVT